MLYTTLRLEKKHEIVQTVRLIAGGSSLLATSLNELVAAETLPLRLNASQL